MKHFDEATVGGRIRKARVERGLTTGELARKVDVSQNFLSVVERTDLRKDIYDTTTSKKSAADKFASDALLINVANCTGVSLTWLQRGETVAQDVAHFENTRLLLTLIMQYDGRITTDTIAAVLNVDDDTVGEILSGDEEYDPLWEPGLSNLIQRLDLPAVRKELRSLDVLLQKEEEKKIGSKVFWALRKHLAKKYKISYAMVGQATPVSRGLGPDFSRFVLQQEGGEDTFNVHYYPLPIDDDMIDGLWNDVSGYWSRLRSNEKLAVVMADADSLAKAQNRFDNEAAMASQSIDYEAEHHGFISNHDVVQAYFGLFDTESGKITEWDEPDPRYDDDMI